VCVIVLELQDQDSSVFDEIMGILNRHPDIEYTKAGTFTIVEEADREGASKWGLLKSYQEKRNGWISLDFAERV